jgi:hypothetical protein
MIDWNIQARAHACQACHKPFANKELFHTLLFDHKHAYERLDICVNCWSTQFSQGATDRKGFVSYWQSAYNIPPAGPPDPIHKETAETLLRKLVEQNDPSHSAARYILAVMLERKRVLKIKAQLVEDHRRVFVYEHAKTGDLFQIPDPDLKLDQLAEVQRDVAHLLEHGPNTAQPPEAIVAAAADNGNSHELQPAEESAPAAPPFAG